MGLCTWRRSARNVCFVVLATLAWPFDASAFDFFGLFGDDTPAVSPQTLPYKVTFEVADGGPSDLKQALQDASRLYSLRQSAPGEGDTLVRRAAGDFQPITDALWGAGYYEGRIEIDIAGVLLNRADAPVGPAAAAAEAHRNRAAVPIKVIAHPGSQFRLREIVFVDGRTGAPFPPGTFAPRTIKIHPGDPARAADLRAAQAAIVDHFRARSHPLAKAVAIKPTVYHRLGVMDVILVIDPGPVAPFGSILVGGRSDVDPRVVMSHIYVEPGDPYSPEAIADARKSVLTIPAISSVRIREAEKLDAQGGLPITAEVTDRKPRVIGFSARYSTLDGPALRTYWQHRNLFGGAESLRLEADIFVPPRTDRTLESTLQDFRTNDLGGRFRASFVKPALSGSRYDFLLDGLVERDRTGGDVFGGYDSKRVEVTAAIRRRFSRTFSAQVGVLGTVGETSDSLGIVDYQLVGLPVSVVYDSTDRLLDPTTGWRVTASATPYLGSVGLFESRLRVSKYFALDEDARYILAGRVGLGSIIGPSLAEIPADHRFYAGGGGSVRGYRYRSLSPLGPTGQVVGGRSLVEASAEVRVKITDTIGIVPFFDVGGAFDSAYPDFQEQLRYAAGIGLRYYTGIGPIRLDFAVPVNPRPGDQTFAVYVGIGQAF